eukprot:GFUD01043591.1.p1 GENE.GFUD01043591.1~~GFUD01043591.1.p1  ORF type:complete len:108 (+),score=34.00 GFUD01043591.1:32-355(+)
MSRAISSLVTQSSRALSAFGARHAPVSNFFITDNNNGIMNNIKGLKFKSGGWQEDNKRWGLLWTMEGNNRHVHTQMDRGFKQKLVKVTTKTGETVLAIAYETSSYSF